MVPRISSISRITGCKWHTSIHLPFSNVGHPPLKHGTTHVNPIAKLPPKQLKQHPQQKIRRGQTGAAYQERLVVNRLLVGGFNPFEKIWSSSWIISPGIRDENKKCLKPPTRLLLKAWAFSFQRFRICLQAMRPYLHSQINATGTICSNKLLARSFLVEKMQAALALAVTLGGALKFTMLQVDVKFQLYKTYDWSLVKVITGLEGSYWTIVHFHSWKGKNPCRSWKESNTQMTPAKNEGPENTICLLGVSLLHLFKGYCMINSQIGHCNVGIC